MKAAKGAYMIESEIHEGFRVNLYPQQNENEGIFNLS